MGWDWGTVLLVGVAVGLVDYLLRRWRLGVISPRELALERQVAALSHEIGGMREQLYESSRRESAALREVSELRETVHNLMVELETIRRHQSELRSVVDRRRRLLLVLGADKRFTVDLDALRAVRSKTGLQFVRVMDGDAAKIDRHLDRARSLGDPFAYVHVAADGNASGVPLGGQWLSWDWLSGVLEGAQVLVIASCESSAVGDWLGVVPYVVTIGEAVGNEDAGRFTQAFWTEIGRNRSAAEAYETALDRCPAQLREFVIAHW